MNANRRSFLRLMGAAPVGVPVAMKEAATKMGMGGLTQFAPTAPSLYGGECTIPGPPPQDHGQRLKDALAFIGSDDWLDRERRQARFTARALDPDLAAMRSLSPSAAYQLQIERIVADNLEREKASILAQMASHAKSKLGF